jgi:TolB-like protein
MKIYTISSKDTKMMRFFAAGAAVLIASSLSFGQDSLIVKNDSLVVKKDSLVNIAVLTLHNADGVTKGEAEIISDRLAAEIFKTGGVRILEREQMKALLAEQGFQQSDECNEEQCMVKIGRILGVQEILTGSLGKVGSMFILNIRIIDVASGRVSKIVSRDLNGMDVVINNLSSIISELVGKDKPAPAPQVEQAPIIPAPVVEAIIKTAVAPAPAVSTNNNVQPVKEQTAPKPMLAGIRIGASIIPGETKLNLDRSSNVALNDAFSSIQSWPVSTPSVKVFLIMAQYISFEAGIGYSIWNQEFTLHNTNLNTDYNLTEKYKMFSIQAGFGGSIPVSNLRLNAGINLGYCFLSNTEDSKITSLGQSADFSYYIVKANANTPLIGAKAGVEIFAAQNFSINLDVIFQYVKFSSMLAYSTSTFEEKLMVELPPAGAVLGMNFYF